MLTWLGKGNPWTQRTRWSPLLQSAKEFRRTLAKERSRSDRCKGEFGFVIFDLQAAHSLRNDTKKLAKILHRRLRDTDEKGHLSSQKVGIMLPSTGMYETQFVMEEILEIAQQAQLDVTGHAFVYPDSPRNPPSSPDQDLRELQEQSSTTEETQEQPAVALMIAKEPSWKRGLDLLGASVGLLLGAPLMLLVAVLIKLTSPGPVFFKQKRTGFLGKTFLMYKFRTMVVNAEELKVNLQESNERDGPAFKMRNDPRITTLGRILRSTGIDELPQLLNVFLGHMSLVGPRPLPVDEASQCAVWQKRRQEVKPGLTCFWQISKSRNYSFADWMRLDLQYSRRVGLGLDLRLILKTFVSVFLGRVGH